MVPISLIRSVTEITSVFMMMITATTAITMITTLNTILNPSESCDTGAAAATQPSTWALRSAAPITRSRSSVTRAAAPGRFSFNSRKCQAPESTTVCSRSPRSSSTGAPAPASTS